MSNSEIGDPPKREHYFKTRSSTASLVVAVLAFAIMCVPLCISNAGIVAKRNVVQYARHGVNLYTVRNDIVHVIETDKNIRNDGTSLIGTFVRLAWHCSGTYSAEDNTGGSNGGRIRFDPEKKWEANAGLEVAMRALEDVKSKHSNLSYADLYTFAGVVGVEYAGGPIIASYELGRTDDEDGDASPPDGRLPDADKGSPIKTSQHMRDVFYRMGFDDREMVCLIGAHTIGRCHTDRSGYWGPWNLAENMFNNALFMFLLDVEWTPKKTHNGKKWKGPFQYVSATTGEIMMLPSCMAMIQDKEMRKYVEMYAEDEALFYKDFAVAFGKLLNLGRSDLDTNDSRIESEETALLPK